MKNNNLDSEGTFLSISENYPIIDALRSYLNIDQKFPNLTFSTKKSDFEENSNNNLVIFPESQILNELNEKIIQNPKGNKSFLWIKPRPGITRGVLSDTFLDLVVLAYIPKEIREFLIPKRKSKYYLIGGWKPKSQTQYCEPLKVHQEVTKKESLENKLIQPLVHFRNSVNNLDKIRLDYFIPLVFLEHHISEGFKLLDNGRRIEKSILVEWGYIQIEDDVIILTEKTKEILMLIQNMFFLEWWRSFFINEKINAEEVKKQMSRLSTCPKEIILRAYLDSITYKHRISFKKSLSEISKFVQIEKNAIVHLIKNWLIGEYYGQECIEGDNFIYPPQKFDRFWANWTVIQNRFDKGLPFFGRKEELDQLNKELCNDSKIILVNGKSGVGKTRLLTELAKMNQNLWNFYWLLLNQEISWEIIRKECKHKKIVLIIDDINRFENWEILLREFLQLEISSNNFKLLVVAPDEISYTLFIANHTKFRNEEQFANIAVNPFDFTNMSIKNSLVRLLLDNSLSVDQIMGIIGYSQGFPEIIEDELNYYKTFKKDGGKKTKTITTFNQRLTEIWENRLTRLEKEILLVLSICDEIHIKNPPIPDIEKDNYITILEDLIHKDLIHLRNGKVKLNRIVIRDWIIKNLWMKKPELKIKLNKLMDFWLKDNINLFVKSLFALKNFLNFVDFKKLILKIQNWGYSDSFTENSNQIVAISKMIPFIAINYIKNQKVLLNEPYSAIKIDDKSLSSDIPQNIISMIQRTKRIWISGCVSQSILIMYDSFFYLKQLLFIIQDFQGIIEISDKFIQIIKNRNEQDNRNQIDLINELYIGIFSIKIIKNPKNLDEIFNKFILIKDLNSRTHALGIWIWCEYKLIRKNFKFQEIFQKIVEASDLLSTSDNKRNFIELWSNFLPYIQILYVIRSNFVKIEGNEKINILSQKMNLAKKWAKSLNLVRRYSSFVLNWIIFDDTIDPKININDLDELVKYTLKNNHIYLTGDIYHQIGIEYFELKDYENSIKGFEQSIKYTLQSTILKRMGDTYFYLGDAYWRLNKLKEAKTSHKRAYKLYLEENKKSDALSALNTVYDINMAQGDYSEAVKISEEILFLSHQSKNSIYYGNALIRIIEANFLQKNYKNAKKYLTKIKSENIVFDDDQQIHFLLLKILINQRNKKKDIHNWRSDLNKYIKKITYFNFDKNSFEFYWIFRCIEDIEVFDKSSIKNLAESLKVNQSLLNKPFSIYETFLMMLDQFFTISKRKKIAWPEWTFELLTYFDRPEQFINPLANFIETFKNPEFTGSEVKLKLLLASIEDRLRNLSNNDEGKLPLLIIEIFNLIPYILMQDIHKEDQIIQIFNILKRSYPLSKMLGNEKKLKEEMTKSPFNFSELLLRLSDISLNKNYFSLTTEILDFVDHEFNDSDNEEINIEIINKRELLAEREGNKDAALKYSIEMDEILKKQQKSKKILINKFRILNLKLDKEVTPEIEKEIRKLYDKSEEYSDEEKFYIKSLNIFLYIRKHQILEAAKHALILIYDKINIESKVWFLSEFIDRIFFQEKITDVVISNKLISSYLEPFEEESSLEKFKIFANYERAFISLYLYFQKRLKNEIEFDNSLSYCIRIVEILNKFNWEQKKDLTQSFMQNLIAYATKFMEQKNFKKVSEIFILTYNLSLKHTNKQIEWVTLNFIVMHFMQLEDYLNYAKWLLILIERYDIIYEEIISENSNFVNKSTFITEAMTFYGLDSEEITQKDYIEFQICYYFIHLIGVIMDPNKRLEHLQQQNHIYNIAWISINRCLMFPVIRKDNRKLLENFWGFLLSDFGNSMMNFYNTSEIDNNYELFNASIQQLENLEGWENDIGKLWALSSNLKYHKIKEKIKKFNILEERIINYIPDSLKDTAQYCFQLLKNSLSDKIIPREISHRYYVEVLKENLKIFQSNNNVNEVAKSLIEIIKSYFILKEYQECEEFIIKAEIIFKKNGRKRELMILLLFEGMINYYKGILDIAKDKFQIFLNSKEWVEFNDFITASVFSAQVKIEQGNSPIEEIHKVFNNFFKIYKKLEKEEKKSFMEILMVQLLSLKKPKIMNMTIIFLESNKIIIKKNFSIPQREYMDIIFKYKLSNCLIDEKHSNFTAIFKKFAKFNVKDAFDIIFKNELSYWLEILSQYERKKFNEIVYKELMKFFNNSNTIKEVESYFEQEKIFSNYQDFPQPLKKSPHYLRDRLIQDFFDKNK